MKNNNLAKFMAYMLGIDPSEFGLVYDDSQRYKIKEVLKALSEVEDYRNVRLGDLKELTLSLDNPVIVMDEVFVTATDRSRLIPKKLAESLPNILYTAIRAKAHAHVLREGIGPVGAPYVIMSPVKEIARQIGKRIDNDPVIVEVRTPLCTAEGVEIRTVGSLFIADYLPAHTFTAPSLPKESTEKTKSSKGAPKAASPTPPLNPGSFFLDLHDSAVSHEEKQRRAQKDKQLKKERLIARRQKQYRNEGHE